MADTPIRKEPPSTLPLHEDRTPATLSLPGERLQSAARAYLPETAAYTQETRAYSPETLDYQQAEEYISHQEQKAGSAWKPGDIVLGLYEVRDLVNIGGYGTIYRVHHRYWNIDLAVKALRDDLAGHSSHITSFMQECQRWVNLGLHPHIVSCYYVRQLGGLPRIFCEYMEGGDLTDLKDRPATEIVDLALQCLEGLSFAHRKGVIHLDIKPGNCLLTAEGMLKITDFGIASGLSAIGDIPPDSTARGNGMTIVTKGMAMTPEYAPPEQWDPGVGAIGPWTDIYAFGVMLFELCCGERPFDEGGEDPSILKVRHLSMEPPEPSLINSRVPPELSRFIVKCLQKKPGDRFSSAAEARTALRSLYQNIAGKPYPREDSGEVERLSDDLNNRAVSLMDLGLRDEALKVWDQALQADPLNARAACNRGLIQWRCGRIDDRELLERLHHIRKEKPASADAQFCIGLVHQERDDRESAVEAFEKAVALAGESPEVNMALKDAREALASSTRCTATVTVEGLSALALSGDGRKIFAAGKEAGHTIDTAAGQILSSFPESPPRGASARILHAETSVDASLVLELQSSIPEKRDRIDYRVILRELPGGTLLKSFPPPAKEPGCMALSPDGMLMLAPTDEWTISLFDLSTRRQDVMLGDQHLSVAVLIAEKRIDLRGHRAPVTALTFLPDGKHALTADRDGVISLFEIEKGVCMRIMNHGKPVTGLSIMPGGLTSLSFSDREAKKWNLAEGRLLSTFHAPPDVSFEHSVPAGSGEWLLITGASTEAKLFHLATGRVVRTLEGHQWRLFPSLATAGGPLAVTGDYGGVIKFWHVGFAQIGSLSHLAISRVTATSALEDAQCRFRALAAQGSRSCGQGDWSGALKALAEMKEVPGFEHAPDTMLLQQELSRHCRKTGVEAIIPLFSAEGHEKGVTCLAAIPGCLISGGREGSIRLWDPQTGGLLHSIDDSTSPLSSLSTAGRYLLACHTDSTLRIYDLERKTGSPLPLPARTSLQCAAISPDGRWVTAADYDGSLYLWERARGRLIRTIRGTAGRITTLLFSPCGSRIITGDDKGTIHVQDLACGDRIMSLSREGGAIRDLSLDEGGMRLLSLQEGQVLTVWNLAAGQQDHQIEQQFREAVLSGDGKWVFASEKESVMLFFQGALIRSLDAHQQRITALALSEEGLLTGCSDGTIRLWRIDWAMEAPQPFTFDIDARALMEGFLCSHTPCDAELPAQGIPNEQEVFLALSRRGDALWTEQDLANLTALFDGRGLGPMDPAEMEEALRARARERSAAAHRFRDLMDSAGKTGQQWGSLYSLMQQVRAMEGYRHHPEAMQYWLSLYRRCASRGPGTALTVRELDRVQGTVKSMSLSYDGKTAAVLSGNGIVTVWKDGLPASCPDCTADNLREVALSHDGNLLILAVHDGTWKIWDCQQEAFLPLPPVPELIEGTVRIVHFSPEGPSLILAGAETPDGCFRLAGKADGSIVMEALDCELEPPGEMTWTEQARPYIDYGLVSSTGSTVDAMAETLSVTLLSAGFWFSRDLIAGEIEKARWTKEIEGAVREGKHGQAIAMLEVRKDRPDYELPGAFWRDLMARCRKKFPFQAREARRHKESDCAILSLSLNQKDVLASCDSALCYREREGLSERAAMEMKCDSDGSPAGIITLTDGVMWAGHRTGMLSRYYPHSSPRLKSLNGHRSAITSIRTHRTSCYPSRDLLLTGSLDRRILLWDTGEERILKTFNDPGGGVTALCESSDFQRLFSGSADGSLREWDIPTGKIIRTLKGHRDPVAALCLSCCGRMLISLGTDGKGRLWSTESGVCQHEWEHGLSGALFSSFSAGGRWAFTGGSGSFAIRDLEKERTDLSFDLHPHATAFLVNAEENLIISGSEDGTVIVTEILWDLAAPEPCPWDESALPLLVEFLYRHAPYKGKMPRNAEEWELATAYDITEALKRGGIPDWNDFDFRNLLVTLGRAGLGHISAQGIEERLQEQKKAMGALSRTAPSLLGSLLSAFGKK